MARASARAIVSLILGLFFTRAPPAAVCLLCIEDSMHTYASSGPSSFRQAIRSVLLWHSLYKSGNVHNHRRHHFSCPDVLLPRQSGFYILPGTINSDSSQARDISLSNSSTGAICVAPCSIMPTCTHRNLLY